MDRMHHMYHLSVDNHHGELFKPHIPTNRLPREDNTTPRVCFADTIVGAWKAMPHQMIGTDCIMLFVHVPAYIPSKEYIVFPTEEQVPDVNITGELWSVKPVRMELIGTIVIQDSFGVVDWGWLDEFHITEAERRSATMDHIGALELYSEYNLLDYDDFHDHHFKRFVEEFKNDYILPRYGNY